METKKTRKTSWLYHIFFETKLGWLFVFMVVSYLAMGFMSYALKGNFKYFSGNTLQSMVGQIPEIGILAIGCMLPMITGGIDLSMIGKANLSGIVAAAFMKALISDFNKEHPDVQINATTLEWGVPFYTKVRTSAAVGQGLLDVGADQVGCTTPELIEALPRPVGGVPMGMRDT